MAHSGNPSGGVVVGNSPLRDKADVSTGAEGPGQRPQTFLQFSLGFST